MIRLALSQHSGPAAVEVELGAEGVLLTLDLEPGDLTCRPRHTDEVLHAVALGEAVNIPEATNTGRALAVLARRVVELSDALLDLNTGDERIVRTLDPEEARALAAMLRDYARRAEAGR